MKSLVRIILLIFLALAPPSGALAQDPPLTPPPVVSEEGKDGPDPTVLTTQQLFREISRLEESQKEGIKALKEIFETRLNAIDRATELRLKTIDEMPANIDRAISSLQMDERFDGIARQFENLDTSIERTAATGKVAIDAALQAQEKSVNEKNDSNAQAIAKSEAGFTKQIDAIAVLISQQDRTAIERTEDLKARLIALESRIEGQSTGKGDAYGGVLGIAGLAFGAAGVIGMFLTMMSSRKESHPPQVVYVPAGNGKVNGQMATA